MAAVDSRCDGSSELDSPMRSGGTSCAWEASVENRMTSERRPNVTVLSANEGIEMARRLSKILEGRGRAVTTVWDKDVFALGQTTLEAIKSAYERSDFAVFLLTADDPVYLRGRSEVTPRANLIFELGLFVGMLGLDRTFLVTTKGVSLPSDIAGLVRFEVAPEELEREADRTLESVASRIEQAILRVGPTADAAAAPLSCFVSYSSSDSEFVRQLHDSLREVGIRTWLDSRDIKFGDSISEKISDAIRTYDLVLLVLSEAALSSKWVHAEANRAMEREEQVGAPRLIPILLDDAALRSDDRTSLMIRSRVFADFRDWRNAQSFKAEVSRLARDLTTVGARARGI